MGTVMMAAFLEWFLWLAAFLYCLIKVFQKAEHWSIQVLAVVMMIGFSLLRSVREQTRRWKNILTLEQIDIPPHHGCYPSSTVASYAALPGIDGVLHAMVCILGFCWPSYHSLAILHLPTRHKLARTEEEDQDCTGRDLSAEDRHRDASLQGRPGRPGDSN